MPALFRFYLCGRIAAEWLIAVAIKVYGSNGCPGTLRFLRVLTDQGVMPDFVNVTGSIGLLKEFITFRDTSPLYAKTRGTGAIGFLLVQLEDGIYTRDLQGVLDMLGIQEPLVKNR